MGGQADPFLLCTPKGTYANLLPMQIIYFLTYILCDRMAFLKRKPKAPLSQKASSYSTYI